MTPDEIARLRAEYSRIGRVLDEIDGAETRRAWREQSGKCYKRPFPTGTTYCTVVGALDSGWPIAFQFETGSTAIEIQFESPAPSPEAEVVREKFRDVDQGERFVEISREEFDTAWRALCARVAAIDPHAPPVREEM